MKKLIYACLFILTALPAAAQTYVTTGGNSGVWTLAGSPYIIQTDLWVPPAQTLQINADVEVRFTGMYRMFVQGTLKSLGTPEMHVVFHRDDTTGWANDAGLNGGWRGMWLKPGGDSSIMRYTDIMDLKVGTSVPAPTTSGPVGIFIQRHIVFNNCVFRHNQSSDESIIKPASDDAVTIEFDSCTISNNTALQGVVMANGPNMTTWIHHSYIHDNTAGMVIGSFPSNLRMEDNEVTNNLVTAAAGGSVIWSTNGYSTLLLRNKIHHNNIATLAAVYISTVTAEVSHNFICNNALTDRANCGISSGGGALFLSHANSGSQRYLVRNNVIANNSSEYTGGAVALYGTNALFTNNTIVNNKTSFLYGGIFGTGSCSLTFTNNIFKGNVNLTGNPAYDSINVYLSGGGSASFSNNITDVSLAHFASGVTLSGALSTNIVSRQPGFVAPTAVAGLGANGMTADFSIGSSAISVNRGDSIGAQCAAKDIAGKPRLIGRVDIGAFENQSPSPAPESVQAASFPGLSIYPNPAAGQITVAGAQGATGTLSNVAGQRVLQIDMLASRQVIDISKLPSGTYLLQLANGAGATGAATITKR